MPECVRCGAFTDRPRSGEYHYCQDCADEFDEIRSNGIVVGGEGEYDVLVNVDSHHEKGGKEYSQAEALARGKLLSDELGVDVIFEYERTGSTWILDEYLNAHPKIRRDVTERLNRVPDDENTGILEKLKHIFR